MCTKPHIAVSAGNVLVTVNFVLRAEPTPLTAVMIATAMPAAINPYSIAVARLSEI
jgi:predicted permease